MAEFTGVIAPGGITTVYSRTAIQLGTRAFDTDGNEYIFLRGVASTVATSWVTYDSSAEHQTTLLAANALGPVAVAMAAIVADKYGWYMIWGNVSGAANYSTAVLDVSDVVGRTGADGYVGDDPPAGDIIYNCIVRSAMADTNTSAATTFSIHYPYVDDQTAAH